MSKKSILILGAVRSGKSSFAQELAAKTCKKVLFTATGEALDEEMRARIDEHKKTRPKGWRTLETPANIGEQIESQIGDAGVVLIDCLTLLVSNLIGDRLDYPEAEKRVLAEISGLTACIAKLDASFIIVSNEVGMGLVPETKLGRIYRDLLGKANQLVAQHVTEVYFMVAGIPVNIKTDRNPSERSQ